MSNMEKYIKALEGITYSQWIKIRMAIDRRFEQEIGEFKKGLKLSDCKKVENIIHQQFG